MEASFPRQTGDKAVLTTPMIGVSENKLCVSFWYHMHGNKLGAVKLHSTFTEFMGLVKALNKIDVNKV